MINGWGLAAILILTSMALAQSAPPMVFRDGERVLFQGDSITDGGRGRNADPNHILGHSYPFLIAAPYGAAYPQQNVVFLNRGLSGNRVADLAKRWQNDALNLKPTTLSIMVGINDVLLTLKAGKELSFEDIEAAYDELLADTTAALPGVRLMLLEPFVFSIPNFPKPASEYVAAVEKFRIIVGRLGEKYHAPVVKTQALFDSALRRAPVEYWVWDGVHPTYAGQQLIAQEWLRVYEQTYKTAATTRPATPQP